MNPSENHASRVVFLCIGFLLGLRGNLSAATHSTEFHAEGKIQKSSQSDPATPRQQFRFTVSMSGAGWLMRTQRESFFQDPATEAIEYMEMGCDGTDLFYVEFLNKQYDEKRGLIEALAQSRANLDEAIRKGYPPETIESRKKMVSRHDYRLKSYNPEVRGVNAAVGGIYPGTIPRYDVADLIAPLWLAFCSHNYFEGASTNLAPIVLANIDSELENGKSLKTFTHAEWDLMKSSPYLPMQVTFTNDGANYFAPARELNPEHISRTVFKTLEPYISARYDVISLKDYNGLRLPEAFECSGFYPKKDSSGSVEMQKGFVIHGKVLSATNHTVSQSFLPEVPGTNYVADLRLANSEGTSVHYFVAPGEWPTISAVQQKPEYLRALNAR